MLRAAKRILFPYSGVQRKWELSSRNPTEVQRFFARSSAAPPSEETPADKARSFVVSLGYEAKLADGIIHSLKQSGIGGKQLLVMVRAMAGRPEVGEDAGLEDLAKSVEQELARVEGRTEINFKCIPYTAWGNLEDAFNSSVAYETMLRSGFDVKALEGMTVTDVANHGDGAGSQTLKEYIECACSGVMACSTCQVVVHPNWFVRVGEPDEDEQDMLDLAFNPFPTSRLGCQVVLSKELDGLVLLLPQKSNNIMDNIPFEDPK